MDVLEEAKKIELGEDGPEESEGADSGRGGSQIFLRDVGDKDESIGEKGKHFEPYEWEISFNEIKLIEKVGEGQFGDVFRGEWLDTEVAVKIPKHGVPYDEIKSFLREIKMMSVLHHPNVVLFLGACITKPNICIVMEYLSGGNLYDYIHSIECKEEKEIDRKDSDLKMVRFAVDIARGMKYLHHRARVIQRDLKTGNLLLDSTQTVKLSDFGLSRKQGRGSTQSYKTQGTPYSVAPEVIRNDVAGANSLKSDVYSFSITLWELFTHKIPYETLNGAEVAYAVAHKNLRPEMTPQDRIPSTISKLIRRCWSNSLTERPDFSDILEILMNEENSMDGLGSVGSSSDLRSQSSIVGVSRGSLGSIQKLPPKSPLANYILGTPGPKHVFFGPTSEVNEELKKIAAATKSGRRASLGSLKSHHELQALDSQKPKEKKGGSLEYPKVFRNDSNSLLRIKEVPSGGERGENDSSSGGAGYVVVDTQGTRNPSKQEGGMGSGTHGKKSSSKVLPLDDNSR